MERERDMEMVNRKKRLVNGMLCCCCCCEMRTVKRAREKEFACLEKKEEKKG